MKKLLVLFLLLPSLTFGQSAYTLLYDSLKAGIFYNFPSPSPSQISVGSKLALNQTNAISTYVTSASTGLTSGWGMNILAGVIKADSYSVASVLRLYKVADSVAALVGGSYYAGYGLGLSGSTFKVDSIKIPIWSDTLQYHQYILTPTILTSRLGSYYLSSNPSNYISLTNLSSSATGLTYTNTTGVFSLASGYVIPTTTEETNWNIAYSNRITSLTTTGSSGSATLSSNTLNIPTYTLVGLGGISLSSLSGVSPITYNTSTGAIGINQANTSTDGYLIHGDWNTFNNKYNKSDTQYLVRKIDSNILGHYVTPTALADSCDTLRQLVYSNMSGYVNYYLDSTHIGNYRTLIPIYSYTTQTISYSSVTNGMILDSFITQSGVPDQATLRSGIYNVHLHATQTSGTKVSALYFQVYTIDTTGHSTLRFTTANTNVLSGSDAGYDANGIISSDIVISNKDRYMIKVLASVTGGGSAPTIQLAMKNNSISSLQAPSAGVSVGKFVPYTGGVNSLDLTGHNGKFDTVNAKVSLSNIYPSPITLSSFSATSPSTYNSSTGVIGNDTTILDTKADARRKIDTGLHDYAVPLTSASGGITTTDTTKWSIVNLVFSADGQGTVVSSLFTRSETIDYNCVIQAWYVDADQSGSIVIDIKRGGTSLIGGGNSPTLSSQQNATASVSGWTSTTVSAGDKLTYSITSVSTITWFKLKLKVIKI